MAPKRPAAASGSASDASDGEADAAHHPSSPSPSKTPPPTLNPNAAALSSTPASAAADSAAAGSDSAAPSDSDADDHLSRPHQPNPKPSSLRPDPEPSHHLHSDSDNSAPSSSSDDDNASPPPPQRPSRAEAASIKPISSRPMDALRRTASEPRAKRPRSATATFSAEQQKRPQRLWSPGDELAILRGLIAYRNKNRALPASTQDVGKLHSHIRGQLSVKVSTSQLSDKVRRLKQKYQMLVSRAKNGRDPDFPMPHDNSIYELAKKVWGTKNGGGGGGGGGAVYENAGGGESEEEQESGESDADMDSGWDDRDRKNRRLRALTVANGNGNQAGIGAANGNGSGKGEFEKWRDTYPYLWEAVEEVSREHPSGAVFKKAFEVLEGLKARAMEEKLQKFRLTEIRQQLRRMDLMKETVKMVLDALERAD